MQSIPYPLTAYTVTVAKQHLLSWFSTADRRLTSAMTTRVGVLY